MICLIKRLFLSALLIVAIQACKKPDNFGTEVQPKGTQSGVVLADTFTINASTVLLDSFNTAYPFHLMVGNYNDPYTGKISAETYSQILLSAENLTFSDQFTYDSLVLIMHANYVYGDSTQPFGVDVYHLTQTLDTSNRYSNQTIIAKEAAPIGSGSYLPGYGKELRIKLNDALGKELFDKGVRQEYTTASAFNVYFKGLAIVNKDGNKAMVGYKTTYFRGNDTANVVRLYTHFNGDLYKYDFPLNNLNLSFNKFKSDLSKTAFASLIKNGDAVKSSMTHGQLAIQAGGSLMTKLTFPGMEAFRKNFSNVVIIKAELILTPETPSIYLPPSYLNVYQANDKNRIVVSSTALTNNPVLSYIKEVDPSGYMNKAYGYYNTSTSNYSINLTSYFQDLMYNKIPNTGILVGCGLGYFTTANTTLAPKNINSVDRIIFNDPQSATNPLKLRIYYQSLR